LKKDRKEKSRERRKEEEQIYEMKKEKGGKQDSGCREERL